MWRSSEAARDGDERRGEDGLTAAEMGGVRERVPAMEAEMGGGVREMWVHGEEKCFGYLFFF